MLGIRFVILHTIESCCPTHGAILTRWVVLPTFQLQIEAKLIFLDLLDLLRQLQHGCLQLRKLLLSAAILRSEHNNVFDRHGNADDVAESYQTTRSETKYTKAREVA